MIATAATALAHVGPFVGHAFFPFFLFIPLFWIIVIVVLAVVFGRRRRRMWAQYGAGMGPWGRGPWGRGGAAAAHSAEATLATRFANGDIDEKEYRARLEVLRSQYPTGPTQN